MYLLVQQASGVRVVVGTLESAAESGAVRLEMTIPTRQRIIENFDRRTARLEQYVRQHLEHSGY